MKGFSRRKFPDKRSLPEQSTSAIGDDTKLYAALRRALSRIIADRSQMDVELNSFALEISRAPELREYLREMLQRHDDERSSNETPLLTTFGPWIVGSTTEVAMEREQDRARRMREDNLTELANQAAQRRVEQTVRDLGEQVQPQTGSTQNRRQHAQFQRCRSCNFSPCRCGRQRY